MKLANKTHKRKQKYPGPADPRNMTSIQEELNAFTLNWIELKTLFIHGILSLQSGILKSRALYNILIRSTNYALI